MTIIMTQGLYQSGSDLFIGNVILPSDMLYRPQAMLVKGIYIIFKYKKPFITISDV